MNKTLGWFFRLFNAAFGASTTGYAWAVGKLLRVNVVVLLVYGALLILTYWVFQQAPTGFVPQQDQGRVIASIQLPDAASLERTKESIALIDKIARATPGVAHTMTVAGYSFVQTATGSNFGSMFVILAPFSEQQSPELGDEAIMAHLRRAWAAQVKDAQVLVFGAPPIPGLSVAGGFKLMVEDRAGLGLTSLDRQTEGFVDKLSSATLPTTMKTEWTELMFIQIRAGNTAIYIFGLAVVCVFLALAALYESWSLPLVVVLVVPLCLLCSVTGVLFTHNSVNIFVQIGLVVLVGLASKNAILIVQFAKQRREAGADPRDATLEASRLRLRAILMTSLAFILGVLPLVLAQGAWAEMRQALGIAVFSGMLGVTLFGIFLTPVFFYVIQWIKERPAFRRAEAEPAAPSNPAEKP